MSSLPTGLNAAGVGKSITPEHHDLWGREPAHKIHWTITETLGFEKQQPLKDHTRLS